MHCYVFLYDATVAVIWPRCMYISVYKPSDCFTMFANTSLCTCTRTHNCTIQDQYVFLHDAILEGYTSGDTEKVVGKLAKRMIELEAVDDEGICGFRKEIEVNNTYIIMYVYSYLMHLRSK